MNTSRMEDAHKYASPYPRMIETTLSESLEMYLETIVRLERRDGKARVTDMARELGVSKPSVHIALHELENRGLAEHEPYGAILLTPAGRSAAEEIARRHGILTEYLSRVLGVSPETAERDACRIEHYLSRETMERIEEKVNGGQ